jgi:hypothetical protein
MVENKQIEYQFDAHWFPDSWLTFLWLGSPDVNIDRRLEMFITEAESRRNKLITQPGYCNKLGSSDRKTAERARKSIASSNSSKNTTPDEQNRIIEVVHKFPDAPVESEERLLARKNSELTNLTKSFSNVHADFKILQTQQNELVRNGYVLSEVDKFELDNLEYLVSSHRSKILELRDDMEKLKAKSAKVGGIALNTPDSMYN